MNNRSSIKPVPHHQTGASTFDENRPPTMMVTRLPPGSRSWRHEPARFQPGSCWKHLRQGVISARLDTSRVPAAEHQREAGRKVHVLEQYRADQRLTDRSCAPETKPDAETTAGTASVHDLPQDWSQNRGPGRDRGMSCNAPIPNVSTPKPTQSNRILPWPRPPGRKIIKPIVAAEPERQIDVKLPSASYRSPVR